AWCGAHRVTPLAGSWISAGVQPRRRASAWETTWSTSRRSVAVQRSPVWGSTWVHCQPSRVRMARRMRGGNPPEPERPWLLAQGRFAMTHLRWGVWPDAVCRCLAGRAVGTRRDAARHPTGGGVCACGGSGGARVSGGLLLRGVGAGGAAPVVGTPAVTAPPCPVTGGPAFRDPRVLQDP